MKKAPVIIMIMSKDDMINYMNSKNAELTLTVAPAEVFIQIVTTRNVFWPTR